MAGFQCPMLAELYIEALLADPVLAVMVKTALEDGLIDRAEADLAWRLIEYDSQECRHHS